MKFLESGFYSARYFNTIKNQVLGILFLTVASVAASAQAPTITEISSANNYPNATVIIKGTGFSNSAAQLRVLFGHVKATIISASTTSIEVQVPPQAKLTTLEVINITTGLSVKSAPKFMPSFYGDTFNGTKFTSITSFPLSTNPDEVRDLCSCDLNNDDKPDIIATKFTSTASNLVVLEQNSTSSIGNLLFKAPVLKTTGIATDNISCGDLDGDGFPDLVVSRANSPRNSIQIIKNVSGAISNLSTWPTQSIFFDGGTTASIATRIMIRDLNSDGKPELIVTDAAANKHVYVLVNASTPGTITFNTPLKISVQDAEPSTINETYGLEVQDLTGDKLPEIIVTRFQSTNLYILKNQSTGGNISFATAQKISISGTLNKITSADFNNDGKLDLAITANVTNVVQVLINQSTSTTFQFSITTLTTDSSPWGIDVSDIDGDLDPDILVAQYLTNKVGVFLHNGNFSSPSFTKTSITTTRNPRDIIAGDFDGDGKPDLAFTSLLSPNYSIEILRNSNCFKPKIINEGTFCTGVTLQSVPGLNVTYTWYLDGVPVKTNSPESFVVATNPGTYTVTATGESGTCANIASSNSVSVASGTAPVIQFTSPNTAVCSGNTLTLAANVTPAATSYEWTLPNGTTSTTVDPTITVNTNVSSQHAGTYKLKAIASTCTSDIATKLIDVIDFNNFTISSPSNAFCQGGNVVLTVDPGYIYEWRRNGAPIGAATNNTYTATLAGAYTVAVSSAVCAPKETPIVNIVQVAPPIANFQIGDQRCTNSDVQFTNTSTVDANATARYAWDFNDGKTSNQANATNIYTTPNVYSVSLLVSYVGVTGCTSTVPQNLTITNASVPVISATPTSICPGEDATLEVSGGTFTAVTWSNEATGSVITVTQPGTYTATIKDASGCILIKDFNLPSRPVPTLTISPESSILIKAGESVQLTASGADNFIWSPAIGLNDPTSENPTAKPLVTTTYTVVGTISGGCSAQSQIQLVVEGSVIDIKPQLAFSPNGDGDNETWVVEGSDRADLQNCTMNIFDGRGRRIYQRKGYSNDWDGTFQGKPVPSGTYYYVLGCTNGSVSGSILVFR